MKEITTEINENVDTMKRTEMPMTTLKTTQSYQSNPNYNNWIEKPDGNTIPNDDDVI